MIYYLMVGGLLACALIATVGLALELLDWWMDTQK